jgi:hypothetical protein
MSELTYALRDRRGEPENAQPKRQRYAYAGYSALAREHRSHGGHCLTCWLRGSLHSCCAEQCTETARVGDRRTAVQRLPRLFRELAVRPHPARKTSRMSTSPLMQVRSSLSEFSHKIVVGSLAWRRSRGQRRSGRPVPARSTVPSAHGQSDEDTECCADELQLRRRCLGACSAVPPTAVPSLG